MRERLQKTKQNAYSHEFALDYTNAVSDLKKLTSRKHEISLDEIFNETPVQIETETKNTIKKDGVLYVKWNERITSKESYVDNFYKMMENSLQIDKDTLTFKKGDLVEGMIYSISDERLSIDAGHRELIYVNRRTDKNTIEYNLGDTVEVFIRSVDKNGGGIVGSITDAVSKNSFNKIYAAIGSEIYYDCEIKEILNDSGYVCNINNVNCFMPGSLAGINKLNDFQALLGKTLKVAIVNYSESRNTIVVSHKKYLEGLIPIELKRLDSKSEYTGTITGTKDYGIFCEFNKCLTGLLSKDDLDEETKIKFNNKSLHEGDLINFKVKEIVNSKKPVLTQIQSYSVWDSIESAYELNTNYNFIISDIKHNGVICKIDDDVFGFLNVMDLKKFKWKVGETITVVITKIDKLNKRISLGYAKK